MLAYATKMSIDPENIKSNKHLATDNTFTFNQFFMSILIGKQGNITIEI